MKLLDMTILYIKSVPPRGCMQIPEQLIHVWGHFQAKVATDILH